MMNGKQHDDVTNTLTQTVIHLLKKTRIQTKRMINGSFCVHQAKMFIDGVEEQNDGFHCAHQNEECDEPIRN